MSATQIDLAGRRRQARTPSAANRAPSLDAGAHPVPAGPVAGYRC